MAGWPVGLLARWPVGLLALGLGRPHDAHMTLPRFIGVMRNPDKYRLTAECEDLAVRAYQVTSAFPRHELYGLTAQIRRGVISIGSNFVEGCGRQGDRAFLAFLHQSLGSANEVQFQLRIARRLDFGDQRDVLELNRDAAAVGRQVASLITSIRGDIGGRTS